MGFFSRFYKAHRVLDSESYRDTIKSVEKIAVASYGLLADKPDEEKAQILERVNGLSEKLTDVIGDEKPLVAALTLLTALRVQHHLIEQSLEKNSGS